jgi:hypothetical protein
MTDIEFKIFDEGKESYIIGDLLNMPYFFARWNNNPHACHYTYNLFKKTALQYPENILGIYDKSRTDENETFPNIQRIRESVDTYIDRNINENQILKSSLELCNEETLFIHLRAGDKGIVENEFLEKIILLSDHFKNIVILCGIHQNAERSHHFPNIEESIYNMRYSLDCLLSKKENVKIDTNEPDVHLSIMRKAKHLLLHKGGFSMLGALLFTGDNLYITELFYGFGRDNFLKELKTYTII